KEQNDFGMPKRCPYWIRQVPAAVVPALLKFSRREASFPRGRGFGVEKTGTQRAAAAAGKQKLWEGFGDASRCRCQARAQTLRTWVSGFCSHNGFIHR